MIYGYVRVSCDKQTTENQFFEISNFAKKQNLHIDSWINETISGTTDINQRKLGKLLKTMSNGDILISTELSRLGRNLLQVMSILAFCMENNISVWTIKDNYRLSSDIQSKIMGFAFSLSAEIERNLISQRTKEALARIKSEGKHLGRPKGSSNIKYKLQIHDEKIKNNIANNVPITKIAKSLGISAQTLRRYMQRSLKRRKKKI